MGRSPFPPTIGNGFGRVPLKLQKKRSIRCGPVYRFFFRFVEGERVSPLDSIIFGERRDDSTVDWRRCDQVVKMQDWRWSLYYKVHAAAAAARQSAEQKRLRWILNDGWLCRCHGYRMPRLTELFLLNRRLRKSIASGWAGWKNLVAVLFVYWPESRSPPPQWWRHQEVLDARWLCHSIY